MESDENQLGPPGAKRKRRTLFTVQEVLDNFEDFSEIHCGNDEDYPEVDLDSTSGDSDNPDLDEDLDLDRFRKRSRVRGLVPYQTGDVGINLDLDVEEEGWNEVYQENDRTFTTLVVVLTIFLLKPLSWNIL